MRGEVGSWLAGIQKFMQLAVIDDIGWLVVFSNPSDKMCTIIKVNNSLQK